jgi:HEAT repeat protein
MLIVSIAVKSMPGEYLKQAAGRLGIELSNEPHYRDREVTGTLEGFGIRFGHDKTGYYCEILGMGKIPEGLKLAANQRTTRHFTRDILIGDPYFDDQVEIGGSEVVALAVLDRGTRNLVLNDVVGCGAVVDNGGIFFQKQGISDVEAAVPQLLKLARKLMLDEQEAAARLARNAVTDTSTEVRLNNLRLLQTRYRGSEALRRANLQALAGTGELCLTAAIDMGRDGLDTIRRIAMSESEASRLRVRAIEHLTETAPAEQATTMLIKLLDTVAVAVRQAAIAGLGELRHSAAVDLLEAQVTDADAGTVAVIANALAKMKVAAAEPVLVQLLAHESRQARSATVRALASIGTRAAVEPLLALTDVLIPSGLSRDAEKAIARIQSRLPEAARGELSLAELGEQEGGLSPAGAADDGSLSLTTPQKPESEQTG